MELLTLADSLIKLNTNVRVKTFFKNLHTLKVIVIEFYLCIKINSLLQDVSKMVKSSTKISFFADMYLCKNFV